MGANLTAQALMNQPEIWPTFAPAVVTELYLTTALDSLRPVPKLEDHSEAFGPLQVFRHESEISGDTVTKLKKNQTKIITHTTSKLQCDIQQERPQERIQRLFDTLTTIRLPFSRKRLSASDINLEEVVLVPNVIPEVVFSQSTRRTHIPCKDGSGTCPGAYLGSSRLSFQNVQTRNMQFTLKNVYSQKFDARKLLGCRLKVGSDFPASRRSSVHIITETYFAEEITCAFATSTNYPAEPSSTKEWKSHYTIRQCPIAFRYVKLKLDRNRIIDDVSMM